MARYLADTNLLLRLVDAPSPQHAVAAQALALLLRNRNEVYLTAQNIIEFWAVATRPRESNGLGWSCERTREEVRSLQERFPLLPDTATVFTEWLRLVRTFQVAGKRVHDARLVAVMLVHGIKHLLTFNSVDFAAFPEVIVVEPHTVA